jgi:hypothetical protein
MSFETPRLSKFFKPQDHQRGRCGHGHREKAGPFFKGKGDGEGVAMKVDRKLYLEGP